MEFKSRFTNKIFPLLFPVLLASCATVAPKKAEKSIEKSSEKKYVRKDWNHWIDDDRNCLDTRAEMLKKHSLVPVTYNKKGCKVKAGKWEDYYYPEIHTLAKSVDIDHVVPLKNAHISGAANWSKRSKKEFANDPDNLVITDRAYNRKKGAKGIDEWLPVKKEFACKYIKKWTSIKNKYSLRLLSAEQNTANILRAECSSLGIKF